jgi:hypothetical protein
MKDTMDEAAVRSVGIHGTILRVSTTSIHSAIQWEGSINNV